MRRILRCLGVLAGIAIVFPAGEARAQSLGTFRWQLQPYCNVVTVTIVAQGAQYLVDGVDDQCGASQRASVNGLAFLNPNATIGFGLSIVTAPGGGSVHLEATLAIGALSGTWRDSTGASGTFAFSPGPGTGGSPRPVSTRGDVTAVTAGTGLAGGGTSGDVALAVDFTATQHRVTGVCPSGQLMTAIQQDGQVTCQSVTGAGGGDITGVAAGAGLSGGGTTGDVSLSVAFAGPGIAAAAARSDHTHATTGTDNTAVGSSALASNVAGGANTALGANALQHATAGGLTAVGANALRLNTTGAGSTGVGTTALLNNTTGSSNTAVGNAAAYGNTTGSRNTAVGHSALTLNVSGNDNVALGYMSQFTGNGSFNTSTGVGTLRDNISGSQNAAFGFEALRSTTNGGSNTAVGYSALAANTTGVSNTAVGRIAALQNTTGSRNVALGETALLSNVSGNLNVATGHRALENNVDGDENVAVGPLVLLANTTANRNVALGASALDTVTTGGANIGIGYRAGSGVTSGTGNIYVGAQAPGNESHTIRIGTTITSAAYMGGISGATSSAGVGVFVNASGQLGTLTSSRRFKEEVGPLDASVLGKVHALTPVQFVYTAPYDDGSRQIQFGLIAEEVADRFPELLVRDADGRPQTVRYHLLTPLLLAEVQRLERERAAQDERLRALEATVAALTNARR